MVSITPAHREELDRRGYVVLDRVITAEVLAGLRGECDRFVAAEASRTDLDTEPPPIRDREREPDRHGITRPGQRWFLANRHPDSEPLRSFLFSDLMADICRVLCGDDAYLFLEQFVVKAAERGLHFAWHQDSGYIDVPHRRYLTCWCALDDATAVNGTISVLPYERAGTTERVEHWRDEATNDLVGYAGDDPGEMVEVPAGGIVAFSSTTLHRSGPNTTDRPRRALVVQWSREPIREPDGSLRRLAEPLLIGGLRAGAS
ncbi:MAG: phytanoyl-CoA dioxygenase family protein, partial [Acidimicrobiales bacterium]